MIERPTIGDKAVFPNDLGKTYALMEIVEGDSFHVERGPEGTVMSWPHLIFRELLLFLAVFVVITGVSLMVDAPLEEPANPFHPPNPAKAPWYFVGLQEMVSHSAFFGGVFIPLVGMLLLLVLPYLDRSPKGIGVWFSRERKVAVILFTIFVLAVVVPIVIGLYMRGPNWSFYWPWERWPSISQTSDGL